VGLATDGTRKMGQKGISLIGGGIGMGWVYVGSLPCTKCLTLMAIPFQIAGSVQLLVLTLEQWPDRYGDASHSLGALLLHQLPSCDGLLEHTRIPS